MLTLEALPMKLCGIVVLILAAATLADCSGVLKYRLDCIFGVADNLGPCAPGSPGEAAQAREAAAITAADDSKCRSYGGEPGTPSYVQCRAQLDAARTQAQATRAATPVIVQQAPVYVPPPLPVIIR
jgi:hypothetical protein